MSETNETIWTKFGVNIPWLVFFKPFVFITDFATVSLLILRGSDALGRNSAILYKGDNFWDFLFVFVRTKTLLNRGLL